ncbi:MAG: hypothetical protein QOD12_2583, partial [Verrucomicrobiota bacterium]
YLVVLGLGFFTSGVKSGGGSEVGSNALPVLSKNPRHARILFRVMVCARARKFGDPGGILLFLGLAIYDGKSSWPFFEASLVVTAFFFSSV